VEQRKIAAWMLRQQERALDLVAASRPAATGIDTAAPA
jgi:hypothetical protein